VEAWVRSIQKKGRQKPALQPYWEEPTAKKKKNKNTEGIRIEKKNSYIGLGRGIRGGSPRKKGGGGREALGQAVDYKTNVGSTGFKGRRVHTQLKKRERSGSFRTKSSGRNLEEGEMVQKGLGIGVCGRNVNPADRPSTEENDWESPPCETRGKRTSSEGTDLCMEKCGTSRSSGKNKKRLSNSVTGLQRTKISSRQGERSEIYPPKKKNSYSVPPKKEVDIVDDRRGNTQLKDSAISKEKKN